MQRRTGIAPIALTLFALLLSSCATRRVEDDMPRRKTFAFGASPVDSNVLNLMQDDYLAGVHDDLVLALHPFTAILGAHWAVNIAGGYVESSGGDPFVMGLPLREGDRLKSMRLRIYGDGAADLTASVYVFQDDGTELLVGTQAAVNPAAAWADLTIDLDGGGDGTVLAAGDCPHLIVDPNGANLLVGGIFLTYDHPP